MCENRGHWRSFRRCKPHKARTPLKNLIIMAKYNTDHPSAQILLNTANGFDFLFSNDIDSARTHFQNHDDPFSLLGTGICAFLEAALGMEVCNKSLILSHEVMLCPRWVSWQKRHAVSRCPRLPHDNVCDFPNPEICLIMVVFNMDWSGRY